MCQGEYNEKEVLEGLREYVSKWFVERYGSMTPVQRRALPLIKEGYNVLISSPTGTGKTLAAFLGIIDNMYRQFEETGELPRGVYVVYVSPLRALNNDIRKNLTIPINEMREIAKGMGVELPEIEVAVRTSDTSSYEKQKMAKDPPHILITTPESLAISLNAPRFREALKNVKVIIVDEIHELASSKRGSHLSLSIERLEELAGHRLQRVGLSATIYPLEDIAAFLVGYNDNGTPRECCVVDARFDKKMDIRVVSPVEDLVHASAEEINDAIYELISDLVGKHRTTLIFTNTRSATERVVFKLRKIMEREKIMDIDEVEAHHGSLSRDLRLEIEEKLKEGRLRAIVSSTSLELGIDIGHIDLVLLLSSPKSATKLLQRVGRAGHHINEVSEGKIIVVDRDDLVECAVLAKLALERKIDRVRIPRNPLDVLAQHIVGMSLERKWGVEDAYKLVRRSYSFHSLPYNEFLDVLRYLSGRMGDFYEYQRVYSKIWFDEEEGVFGRKRSSKIVYYENVGVIPDEAKSHVFTIDNKYVGDLEEAFVEYLVPGDLFVLGGRVYEYLYTKGFKVIVKRADGMRPTVPSWFSEILPLAYDSALEIGAFRRKIAELLRTMSLEEVINYVKEEYGMSEREARAIVEYINEQRLFTGGVVPSDKVILLEIYDEGTTRNIIVHSLVGRRANEALARLFAYVIGKELGLSVKITVTDNGFMLSLDGLYDADWAKLFASIEPDSAWGILERVLRRTDLLKRRFRQVAVRSFMLLRRHRGYEKSLHKLQVNAEELLKAVEEIPGFPVLRETYREILIDYMHIDEAVDVLKKTRNDEISVAVIGPNDVPSPFAHGILLHGYSDVVLMEDMRRMLSQLHRKVIEKLRERGPGPAQ